jgi:predicted RNase H-like nuclease (RuvC/YqgF family)
LDILSSKIRQLLRDKVQKGLKGSASGRSGGSDDDVEQKLRHENRELYRHIAELHRQKEALLEHLKDAKVELAEFKLAEANRRNEELLKRIAVLERERQGMDTPTTSVTEF